MNNSFAKKNITHITDGYITKYSVHWGEEGFNSTQSAGVYDSSGKIIKSAERQIQSEFLKTKNPSQVKIDIAAPLVKGKSIYLGQFTIRYGHFLLETLSRCWGIEHINKIDNFIFHPFIDESKKHT